MASAVVFYSLDGNTKVAAEEIARQKNASVFELKEKNGKRKGAFGFMKSGFQAATKGKSKLLNDYSAETKEFDTLYIGSPVWASSSTPAVNAYVNRAELSGKKVFLFFCCASKESDYKPQNGVDYLGGIIRKKGGTLAGVYVFSAGAPGHCISAEEMAVKIKEAIK